MNAMKQVPAFESGGAGLVSTLDDYAKFAAMLLQEGSYQGKQILKPQTVHYMTNGTLMSWQQEVLDQCWEGIRGYTYANLLRIQKEPGKSPMFTSIIKSKFIPVFLRKVHSRSHSLSVSSAMLFPHP